MYLFSRDLPIAPSSHKQLSARIGNRVATKLGYSIFTKLIYAANIEVVEALSPGSRERAFAGTLTTERPNILMGLHYIFGAQVIPRLISLGIVVAVERLHLLAVRYGPSDSRGEYVL